ncbi:MAG: DNA polymerase III subunit epsilon [Rhodospirillales bacterium]
MREIALDTETTGLDPAAGHRIVEIGCVEMVNHVATGRTFHQYVNPERDMPEEAYRVHGLDSAFLDDKPVFAAIADDFLAFIEDAPLVIHNAAFDMGFINAELVNLGRSPLPDDRAVDTVNMARRKFPGARASLDALCQRFNIDIAHRDLHGALKDAKLLADVYLELIGGRQPGFEMTGLGGAQNGETEAAGVAQERAFREPRPHSASAEEEKRHAAFLDKIKDPIWSRA